ncbi:VOC family protein [Nocardiopsis suaedae]|uniref:Glyoxalase n=1 Tax=Nocardiopsis suaedae TaxID=3018444 RepID=A0ABT4TJ33_9ACTN|nr:glyoxalase [Nocardiopsis suaedae]MDA2804708.1 glyoxalase [Nocardiopsis suaedae]
MANIDFITLGATDPAAAEEFYSTAFGLDGQIRVRESQEPTDGFRGYTLSLTAAQPGDVDLLVAAALDAGAEEVKPATKSFWGYGGTLRAPDGAVWTIATSTKKDKAPAARRFDDIVLLLGPDDVAASKRFYVEHGLTVSKSFGSMYVEFDTGDGPVKFGLNRRRALAKNAGVAPGGTGAHRLAVCGDLGAFTDPDGFAWEAAAPASAG